MSAIALAHGIDANVIRKWLPRLKLGAALALATMLAVTIQSAAPTATSKPRIDVGHGVRRAPIELTLGAATVRLPHGFDPLELRSIVQILSGTFASQPLETAPLLGSDRSAIVVNSAVTTLAS